MGSTRTTQQAASHARLPKAPGVVRGWMAAHPGLINGTILGFYVLGAALMALIDSVDVEGTSVRYWLSVVCCSAVAVALWWRTRAPMVGLVLTAVLGIFDLGSVQIANSVALLFFLYAVPVYRGARAGWAGYAVALLGTVISILSSQFLVGLNISTQAEIALPQMLSTLIVSGVWYLAIVVIGINMGNRRRYVEALLAHAEQLIRDQEQQGQLAAAAERARIAREMHDIIAHSLSVVVTLTEAASVSVDSQPEAAKFALHRASETGRNALSEMRRLLGVLSDPATGTRSPQPQLSDLPQLCSGFTEAGLRISISESGVAHHDAGHQIAVYRIVQEALTNTLRYAGDGAEVRVDLRHTEQETLLSVTDSGPRNAGIDPQEISATQTRHDEKRSNPSKDIPGTGRGLAGAKQRAEMYGGELTAGPYASGWKVSARLPYPDTEASSHSTPDATREKRPR